MKAFKASLEHRGYEQKKGRSGNIWVGVELVVEKDDLDEGIVCLDAMRRDTRTPVMVTSNAEPVCG